MDKPIPRKQSTCGGPAPENDMVQLPRDQLEELKYTIIAYGDELARLQSQPLVHVTVTESKGEFNLAAFEKGDRVYVLDKKLCEKGFRLGSLESTPDKDGFVTVGFTGRDDKLKLNIGLKDHEPQCKLINKDDGLNVIVAHSGKLFEVHGHPSLKVKRGNVVKVDLTTMQIHAIAPRSAAGEVAYAMNIIDDDHIEVEVNGSKKVVLTVVDEKIEPSNKLMLDESGTVVLRVLKSDGADEYSLKEESKVTWDDIAGLENVKQQIREVIELPFLHPDIFAFYNKKPPKGILKYGPPGCGKTLLAKATANSIAKLHGKEAAASGFIYVKGPQILNKYVGNSEAAVRALFARGNEHFDKYGYPAVIVIDEAESIMQVRGSGKSSDVENTIVPSFLAEMDGLAESKVVVMILTNRPKLLDPAVVREGRVDRHIRVPRPTLDTAEDYFKIHANKLPIVRGEKHAEVLAEATKYLFDDEFAYYNIENGKDKGVITLGDFVSGAMIQGICERVKMTALNRDLTSKKRNGACLEDFQRAIQDTFDSHLGLNHKDEIEEFCETSGISRQEAKITKICRR